MSLSLEIELFDGCEFSCENRGLLFVVAIVNTPIAYLSVGLEDEGLLSLQFPSANPSFD